MRVLLTYAVPRSGHAHAAHAVAGALDALPGCSAEEYHLMQWHPRLMRFFPFGYRLIARHTPNIWRHFHGNTRYSFSISYGTKLAMRTDWLGLKSKIRRSRPDVLVATHFVFAQLLGSLRSSGKIKIPVAVIVTDYRAHRFWAHPGVDRYFVPSDDARDDLVKNGVSASKVEVTGMPVGMNVLERPSREKACERLRLDPAQPVVLVIGGSYGLFPFADILKLAAKTQPRDAQWLFLTGSDRAMFKHLSGLIEPSAADRLRIFPFQSDISPFLGATDIAVTKPGGLFSTEALVSGIPLVLYKPLPGQEEANAEYFSRHNAAILATSPEKAVAAVRSLLSSPAKREQITLAGARLAHPDAARQIAEKIIHL